MRQLFITLLLLASSQADAALYAIVTPAGSVINLVQWDGVSTFNVSPNTLALATGQPNAQIGGTFIGGVFTAPGQPAAAQGIIFANSPTNGATLSLPNAPQPQAKLYVILQPAGALSSLTLNLPVSPQDGDDLYILSTQTITTVTPVLGPGQGKVNIPASFTLSAGVSQHITWSAQNLVWFRL